MTTAHLFQKCFHGGAFFESIGERFDDLDRSKSIINADVLDAWFPAAPPMLEALAEYLPWLLRTSPPTHCAGLIDTIAEVRGVNPENVLPGAGSSDLIFRALRQWLNPLSNVLLLDPTYGEYAHVLEEVIGCRVARFELLRSESYDVSSRRLHAVLQGAWDLVVLVNPNSPTGRHLSRRELQALLEDIPESTRVWIDETYVEYAGVGESLERFAARAPNVIVCKSMSKVYALSGARVAYLCGARQVLDPLRQITPPWVVGLPSQVAAARALQAQDYYDARYAETHALRESLAACLRDLQWEVIDGVANFLLCHLPPTESTAADVVARARGRGLFLRDASRMGTSLGDRAVRIAVKDAVTNDRMLRVLRNIASHREGQGRPRDAVPVA